jgi:hypothetical protein
MLKGKFSFLKFLMAVVMVLAIVSGMCEIKASAENIKGSEIEVIYLFDKYGKWDAVNGERLEIQKELTKLFKELDIVIGELSA